jgi:hypothetical protein
MWLPVLAFILLTGCNTVRPLPSRPIQDLFPQADSPAAECPGQYRMDVNLPNDDGSFFIYCFGKSVWN